MNSIENQIRIGKEEAINELRRLITLDVILQDENKRLQKRDCNATVELLFSKEDEGGNPFGREDCRVVDASVSDNVYVVECDAVNNLIELKKAVKVCREINDSGEEYTSPNADAAQALCNLFSLLDKNI